MRRNDAMTRRRNVGNGYRTSNFASLRLRVFACLRLCVLASFSACATPGQVRMVQDEVHVMRIENSRRDSARAAALAVVLRLQDQILDSLAAGREALRTLDVRLQGDLTDVQRQLLQVQ